MEGHWYGGARITTPVIGERYILDFSHPSGATGQQAGRSFQIVPGRRCAIFSPGQPASIQGGAGHRSWTVTVERGALESHFRVLTGSQLPGPLLFEPSVDLEDGPGAALQATLDLLRREMERPGASPLWLGGLRDLFLTCLLTNARHSASALLEAPRARVAPGCVRRAEEFIAAHVGEAISLADIVAAAGVPARSLRAAFAASRGVGPMAFLRQRRLDLARQVLLEAPHGTTVASVVAALGLGGAGRFSIDYRRRFGESPSETLALASPARGSRPV